MEYINNLSEFDSWHEKILKRTNHILFRGQENSWPILPSIARIQNTNSLLTIEEKLLSQFKLEAKRCLHQIPTNDWEWLVVAQHHGLPTRLVDWSTNPYAALWFAVEKSDTKRDITPEVFVLQPLSEDYIQNLDSTRPFRGSRTKLFETSFQIPRVKAQSGCFALMKYDANSINGFVALEKNKYLKDRITKIHIKPDKAPYILKQLEKKGFTHERMYPDIDKVAKQIKNNVLGTV